MSNELDLLRKVAAGDVSPDEALESLKFSPFNELMEGVTVDPHRCLRTGQGEVVYGRGKSPERLSAAVSGLRECGPVLATKLTSEQGHMLAVEYPEGDFWEEAGLFALDIDIRPKDSPLSRDGEVIVLTAGASDMPVALEAYGALRFFGVDAGLVGDVGVAGLHRIQPHLHALNNARLLIVTAGMEGALASVVGGLCGKPILAVPTSVGYGASFGGLAALLAMLNSCAPGVAVLNIDNGFGAASMAARLLDI